MDQRQFGNDIATVGAANLDACKKACTHDSKCKAATYEPVKFLCFLHSALGSTSRNGAFDHIFKICTGKCSNFFARTVQLLSIGKGKMKKKTTCIDRMYLKDSNASIKQE